MSGGRHKTQEAFLLAVNPTTNAARELKLIDHECSLGSEESNDLIVNESSVSRRHASFRQHRSKWQVLDIGSSNGTYLEDRRITEWTTLRDGQELRFGGTRFVFRTGRASVAGSSGRAPARKLGSRLRTFVLLGFLGLIVGFATVQYFLYRSYHHKLEKLRPNQNERELLRPGTISRQGSSLSRR